MAKRVLAVVVAIVLVVLAFVVRNAIDDNGGGGGTTPGTTTATTASHPPTVVCATELQEVCALAGIAGTVEPAGQTAARLEADGAQAPDAWVTLDPWPAMVDEARTRKNLEPLFAKQERLASSPLALIGPVDRMAALGQACGGAPDAITWKCIGEKAGAEWGGLGGQGAWGKLKPGHASPVDSAAGLLVFANAVVSYFGRSDISAIDLSTDAGFLPWVTRLEQAVPTFGDALTTPLDLMLVQPRFDVVGTTKAEIAQKAAAQASRFTVTYPAPMAQADAVLAAPGAVPPIVDAARAALTKHGWTAPTGDPTAGLPQPGVMEALQDVWREVTR
jgi:hypothetical protein